MGVRVEPEQVLILQMHYFVSPGSEGLADQSGYAFRTAASVETEVAMTQLGLLDFEIPAGASDLRAGGTFKPRTDQEIVGIFPHMHLLGSSFTASIEPADGFMLATTDPDEPAGDVVEDVDPGSLHSGQVQINLGADVAGMVLGAQCVGTVTVEAEGAPSPETAVARSRRTSRRCSARKRCP